MIPLAWLLGCAPAPEPAVCVQPTMDELYPGLPPPNPFDDWPPAAEECLVFDVIIVLGCPSNEDGTASDCQVARADRAVRLAGYTDWFITSGAAVHNEFVEAEALRDLLVARGIAEDHVLVEPLAEHTDENLYWSSRLMQDRGWTRALVDSEPDHLEYAAVCDANCCVGLGRLATVSVPVEGGVEKVGSYVLGASATAEECAAIDKKFMCTQLDDRRACADDFQL